LGSQVISLFSALHSITFHCKHDLGEARSTQVGYG